MISSTNMAALYSANAANKWSAAAIKASERISTTYRINRSSDDPSGMMMATSLSAELSSYSRTLDNIHSGIAAIQKVDASLSSIASYLTEMRTLAVTAASTTDTDGCGLAHGAACDALDQRLSLEGLHERLVGLAGLLDRRPCRRDAFGNLVEVPQRRRPLWPEGLRQLGKDRLVALGPQPGVGLGEL